MASLIDLLASGKKEILLGEIVSRSGDNYNVDLRDRTVVVKSSLTEILSKGMQVFVADIENQLRIIAKADIKTREEKETVIVNG